MTEVRGFAKGKAIVLGGFATGAVLCFGLFFAGIAWFVTAWYFDDRRDEVARNGPAAVFALGLLTSSLIAARFGSRVGRDWYRNGR